MKNTIKLVALAAFMFMSAGLFAQQKAVKLGHIDMDKLLLAMPETTKTDKFLQAKKDTLMKESMEMREQLQAKAVEFSEKSATYSEVMKRTKQQELEELSLRIQRFEENASGELQRAQTDMMQPLIDKALKAVQDVSKEKGFTYILNNQALVYASEDSEDILPLVKAKLGIQ